MTMRLGAAASRALNEAGGRAVLGDGPPPRRRCDVTGRGTCQKDVSVLEGGHSTKGVDLRGRWAKSVAVLRRALCKDADP